MFNVLFVASRGKQNILAKSQGDSINKKSVNVSYFSLESGIINYFMGIVKLRKHLAYNRYNIIHAHYGWCGLVSFLARNNTVLVVSFMGDDLVGTLNKNYEYTFAGRIVSILNTYLAKHYYDYNIVKSQNLLYKLKGLKNADIIPNGVDLNVFKQNSKTESKKTLNWDFDKKYVIFVSDPEREEKNYKLAKAAIDVIKSNEIELIVVNNIPNEKLYLYYSAADCLILTSIHEGSPNVIKEAMACNCPIVSTEVGDVKWVIGNTNGCYISSYDGGDAAKKIMEAIKYSVNMGRTNGRDRIIELGLDSESVADKIINIYKKVLEK